MLKIIAIALLATGAAALVAGIIIFIVTGGMNLLKEIRQARNISFDYSTQNTASDIYYNKADNTFKEPKKKAKFNTMDADGKQEEFHSHIPEGGSAENDFSVEDMFVEESKSGDIKMQTSPLKPDAENPAAWEEAQNTAPLQQTAPQNTAPLMQEEPNENIQNTAPLVDIEQNNTDTAPLAGDIQEHSDTAPLTGMPQNETNTAPLDMPFQEAASTEPLMQAEEAKDTAPLTAAEEFGFETVDIPKPEENSSVPFSDEKNTAPLLSKKDTAPLVNEKDTAPLGSAAVEEGAAFSEEARNTAPLTQQEEPPIEKPEMGKGSGEIESMFEEIPEAEKVREKPESKWQTAPLIDMRGESDKPAEKSVPKNNKSEDSLKGIEKVIEKANTAPLEKDYADDVIDEISEVKSRRVDDIFVDFEELFKND